MQTTVRKRAKNPPAAAIYRGSLCQTAATTTGKGTATGFYYFGARYLDPRISRWLGVDPALGEYFPVAPNGDEAKRHNQNLPNGGIFNYISFHVYNYSNNNPVMYTDPDGRLPIRGINVTFPPKGLDIAATRQLIVNSARNNLRSSLWNFNVRRTPFNINTWKCNLFVYEMTFGAGASPGKPNGRGQRFGFGTPPTASQWADPNYNIPGWRVLSSDETPMPGDVAAQVYQAGEGYTGHVAIVSEEEKTIGTYSGEEGQEIRETTWGFRENQEGLVTFRRWEGNE